MQRTLWLVLAVLGLGAAGWLALGRGDSERPFELSPLAGTPADEVDGPVAPRAADEPVARRDEIERQEIELARELGMIDGPGFDATMRVALQGRVVDDAGRPVAGAIVSPTVRRSARAMFERGRPDAQEMDWRALFRDRPLATPAKTQGDGSFAFRGDAFQRGSSIQLAVQHEQFAPGVIQREWTPDAGDIVLEDIVLGAGATVAGVVVDGNGTPVPDATVAFDGSADGRGGFGGRGGRGGGGRGGGRFGDGDRLPELVGDATTDAGGRFVLDHVPAGRFRLTASATRHVDGRSETTQSTDGAHVDVGEIVLGPGAILSGIVLDLTGGPVAGADVTASVSRMRTEDPGAVRARGPGAKADAGGRGGRGPAADAGQRDRGLAAFAGFGGARQTTTTDREGRFVLDHVPQLPLRVDVEHGGYIDAELEPIEPLAQPEVLVQLRPSPTARGVVVDARSGEPIETFGIRARPMPNGGGFGGRGGDRGGDIVQRLAEASPEMADRLLEMQAQREREDTWRKQQVGGSGVIPGQVPAPTAHPGGRFALEDLQPGDFLFEVDAPGYVRVAAGPFKVSAEGSNENLVVALERGYSLAGRVVHGRSGEPVAGARVTLALRALDDAAGGSDPRGAMFAAFGGRGGGRGGRGGGGRDQLDQDRTGRDGRFELRPLRAGTYQLGIEAEGFPGMTEPTYTVGAASGDVEIRLDPGGRVHGVVFGIPEGERTRLEFSHAESGETRRADVNREDGTYEVAGLLAGGWFVRVVDGNGGRGGGGRGGRGQNGGDFMARIGTAVQAQTGSAPDVVVPPGGDVRYDVGIDSLQLATVRGRVFRNGGPGDGLEVRLVSLRLAEGLDPQIARFARGRIGQLWSDRVDGESGTFTVESVPPGEYRLEVHARAGGRGGRGGGQAGQGGALHSEPIAVRKGETAERMIEIALGALELVLQTADGQPVGRGRASIVLASDAGDTAPDAWNDLPSLQRLPLRDGRVASSTIRPGAYRYSIEARGYRPATGTIQVGASDQPVRATVRVEVDPNAPAEPQNAGGGPQRGPGSGGGEQQGGARRGGASGGPGQGRGGAGQGGGRRGR